MCGSRNNWRCPSLSVAVLTTGELQKARLIFYEVRMLKLYAVSDEYIPIFDSKRAEMPLFLGIIRSFDIAKM